MTFKSLQKTFREHHPGPGLWVCLVTEIPGAEKEQTVPLDELQSLKDF